MDTLSIIPSQADVDKHVVLMELRTPEQKERDEMEWEQYLEEVAFGEERDGEI